MNTLTNIQIINSTDGSPAFVVIPYSEYIKQNAIEDNSIPNEIVGAMIKQNLTPIQAWRDYLQLTPLVMASRLGISETEYTDLETQEKLDKKNLKKIAVALGITVTQLNV